MADDDGLTRPEVDGYRVWVEQVLGDLSMALSRVYYTVTQQPEADVATALERLAERVATASRPLTSELPLGAASLNPSVAALLVTLASYSRAVEAEHQVGPANGASEGAW
jgi:hypothetical protein